MGYFKWTGSQNQIKWVISEHKTDLIQLQLLPVHCLIK